MQKASEEELVARAKKGDRDAFEHLVRQYYLPIYRFAYKWCAHQSDAEDIAQDVVINMARGIAKFDGRSAFSSWIFKITLNRVRDMGRTQQRHRKLMQEYSETAEAVHMPSVEQELTQEQVWRKILELPDKHRDVLMLVYSEGMNHKCAAEILGCSEKTVSWRVHEAKKNLRILVEG